MGMIAGFGFVGGLSICFNTNVCDFNSIDCSCNILHL